MTRRGMWLGLDRFWVEHDDLRGKRAAYCHVFFLRASETVLARLLGQQPELLRHKVMRYLDMVSVCFLLLLYGSPGSCALLVYHVGN